MRGSSNASCTPSVSPTRSPTPRCSSNIPPVYTAGRRTEPHERPLDGTPVVDVDRGGKITFHGPGQLVGYPITKLPSHVLVVDYVRRVEEAMIRACADLGVTTGRVAGRSGVWLAASRGRIERKVGAIGIRVSRGVTMHGFSLNADVDLGFYDRFVPCGIADAGVTTLSAELGRDVTVARGRRRHRPAPARAARLAGVRAVSRPGPRRTSQRAGPRRDGWGTGVGWHGDYRS